MHQDSTGRVHSGIASQISFAVGNALRNPDQFRSVPLIGEPGRVVKHENKIVRCRYTLTRGLEMARQNVSFADAMIGKKTVGRRRVRPILANERNTLPYVAADPLKQCAKSLAKPRIPKLAPGDFTINPRCCKAGGSIIVPVRAVTQRQAHGAPSLPNQVLSNESQRILPIQVFISRSTPQTHPELWVIESSKTAAPLDYRGNITARKVLNLSSRMEPSIPSRSCPPRTPRGAWPASSCRPIIFVATGGGQANYSAGNTTSTPFFFRRITMNFAGSVVLALRPTVCTSL